jgi:quinolinate synthase
MAENARAAEITELRKKHGPGLMILGHFYERASILSHADIIGDSYKLSVEASRSTARAIVFCGVHFMAESARVLCKESQRVFIPDHEAGCPLADTITPEQFLGCFDRISAVAGEPPVPLVYVNSSAELKSLAGRRDGICCTSSNAALISRSLLREGRRIFFLPDRNLGRNVGEGLELAEEEMSIVSPGSPVSAQARLHIWDGCCPVHERFTLEDVRKARQRFPGCRILVHPETPPPVVRRVDGTGSTSQLFEAFEKAPPGSVLVIGTEIEFVTRLGTLRRDVTVVPLAVSRCRDMGKITEEKLLRTLRSLEEPGPEGEVCVEPDLADGARKALARMIERVESAK